METRIPIANMAPRCIVVHQSWAGDGTPPRLFINVIDGDRARRVATEKSDVTQGNEVRAKPPNKGSKIPAIDMSEKVSSKFTIPLRSSNRIASSS